MHKAVRRVLVLGAVAPLGVTIAAGSVHADPAPNFIVGTSGNDVIVGSTRNDYILGLGGDDHIVGNRGNDIIRGGRGNDVLRDRRPVGHSGIDVLRGGRGRDTCIGDAGDTFRGCEVIVIR